MFSTRLERGGASFRPIHDQTLHHEATLLSKALAILAKLKVPPRRVYELKTDSILFGAGVRSKNEGTGGPGRDHLHQTG